MMHTHLLSPVKFAADIAKDPRYATLAGTIDFPLRRMLVKIQHKNRNPDDGMSQRMWSRKYNLYYDMLNDLEGKTFPPRMSVSAKYYPGKMRWTPHSIPFSLDLVQAVKRQIEFTRKITAIYPYNPIPEKLLLDSQLRYVKFMNLIRLNACSTPVPAMAIDLFWHTH